MRLDRRGLLAGSAAAGALVLATGAQAAPFTPLAGPRSRVIHVNDLSGDIDGLFACVHAILSPSAQLQAIIGTTTGRKDESAARSAALASEMLALTGRGKSVKVFAGAEHKLTAPERPVPSPGTQAIIDEAMRGDTQLPLYVTVGGGLTEVASALLFEPRIAARMTVVWIGGDALPGGGIGETNFNIDAWAAQHVFNAGAVPIWQVPRSVYATCVVSNTELQAYVAPCGPIGAWLYRKVVERPKTYMNVLNMGETWTLGDSPLVLLTALSDWVPSSVGRPFRYERTGSSAFDAVPCPRLNPDGTFTARTDGRPIRIYKSIDTRLMLGDFFAKLRVNAAG